MITYLEKYWCALFVSEGWYESWRMFKDYSLSLPEGSSYRRMALRHKTIGIIEFDRTLNNYDTNKVEKIFVFGGDRDST